MGQEQTSMVSQLSTSDRVSQPHIALKRFLCISGIGPLLALLSSRVSAAQSKGMAALAQLAAIFIARLEDLEYDVRRAASETLGKLDAAALGHELQQRVHGALEHEQVHGDDFLDDFFATCPLLGGGGAPAARARRRGLREVARSWLRMPG